MIVLLTVLDKYLAFPYVTKRLASVPANRELKGIDVISALYVTVFTTQYI